MEVIKISTAQNVDIDYEVAGLGERIAARLIDLAGFVALYFLSFLLGIIGAVGNSPVMLVVSLVIAGIIFVFYDLVCELTMNGQSLGKKALKIKVISLDGSQPTLSQYLFRWLFRIIDFGFPFGWGVVAVISVAMTKNHQRLGDLIAKTTLIKTVPRAKYEQVAFNFNLPEDYHPVFNEVIHLTDRDVELVHEVVSGYYQTGNPDLIYAMAAKIKEHLSVQLPEGMNELRFLETIVYDYNFLTSRGI